MLGHVFVHFGAVLGADDGAVQALEDMDTDAAVRDRRVGRVNWDGPFGSYRIGSYAHGCVVMGLGPLARAAVVAVCLAWSCAVVGASVRIFDALRQTCPAVVYCAMRCAYIPAGQLWCRAGLHSACALSVRRARLAAARFEVT